MAKCYICNKTATTGNKRSHSNIATKRKFKINLQSKEIEGKKRTVCTRCIKTLNKEG
ncbi:MAG: bL28 family ribosomal protein [Candidatus Moranbacteria bacterium]|nr:bL28 family ribosomal protein [Candidatus Moranbacteria bacterium]